MPLSTETVTAVTSALLQASQAKVETSGGERAEMNVIVDEVAEAARWLASEEGLSMLAAQTRAALRENDVVPRSLTVTGAVTHMYKQTAAGGGELSLGERFNKYFTIGDSVLGDDEDGFKWTVFILWPMLLGVVLLPLLGVPPLVDWSYADTPGLHWLLVTGAVTCGFSLFCMYLGAVTALNDAHSIDGAVEELGVIRAVVGEPVRECPGLLTPRTSLLLFVLRVLLAGAAVAMEWCDIAANDDFTFGPLGDAISGVYMLGEALLTGYAGAAATSPLSWAFADSVSVMPLANLCPYVLPTGVTWSDHPFAGQLLLSPLSVLLVPVFAVLQWGVVGLLFPIGVARSVVSDAVRDKHWIIRQPVWLCVVFPLSVVLSSSIVCFLFASFACAGAVFPVLLVFIGPSMISAGSVAQGVASSSLCINIITTHLHGDGMAVMLVGLDASKTAQLAVLYTILVGWCGYLLLQQTSHGLSTPDLLRIKYGEAQESDSLFMLFMDQL